MDGKEGSRGRSTTRLTVLLMFVMVRGASADRAEVAESLKVSGRELFVSTWVVGERQ